MEKLLRIAEELNELKVKYSQLAWTFYTTGYDFGLQEQYQKITKALKNRANYEHILNCREKDLNQVDQRRVEIMCNLFRPFHLSSELNELDMQIQQKVNELSGLLNTFRYSFEGRKVSTVELGQILTREEDRNRRKEAFLARNQINGPMIDAGFLELIDLRKEYARLYGAENFISFRLEKDELEEEIFAPWLNQLHEALPQMEKFRNEFARKFLDDEKIMPWDERFIESQLAPALNEKVDMSEFYQHISELFSLFNLDLNSYNITYDIFPRANKSEWGYNFPVETAKDSRILANVKNRYHEYGVLLHETGHGVHSFLMDPDELILNQGVSGIISEGIANLFGDFLYRPAFYEKFFDGENDVGEQFSRLREYQKINSLRSINRIFFDRNLYRGKMENLDDVYQVFWKTFSEVLKEEPYAAEPPWAFTIHHTTHPIYLHNYLMGDVVCAMLEDVFERDFDGGIESKPAEFGTFLKEKVVEPSGQYRFNELFKKISGEDFNLKFLWER